VVVVMIGYFEDEKFIDDGISYPFKTHVQDVCGKERVVDVHYHEHIEILYCLNGCFSLFLNGTSSVFEQGDMVIINAMEAHSVFSLAELGGQYVVIRFQPELLYTTAQSLFESKYILPFTMHQSTHQRVFKAFEIGETFVPGMLLAISDEDAAKAYGFELAIRTYLGQIFLWILRRWHKMGLDLNVDSAIKKGTLERLQGAFDYVRLHYDQPIQAADVAKRCNVSYSYFCRVFKQLMGRSFTDYLNYVRLSRAEHFLMATDMTVTEVALAVGFTTSSYFIAQFKAHKGVTPKHFRSTFLKK
jgi:AraC-like DNA-binding protein/mannose-6-phosphate isomerase-like protein (cupin superfamily)